MIKMALVIGLAFVIQFVLSSFQMKNFNNETEGQGGNRQKVRRIPCRSNCNVPHR
jgi:hypothetical protein